MTRTKRLAERAITFAIAEPDEDLAVARLAFLAQGDHTALDRAIEACLARRRPQPAHPLAGDQLPGAGALRRSVTHAHPQRHRTRDLPSRRDRTRLRFPGRMWQLALGWTQ